MFGDAGGVSGRGPEWSTTGIGTHLSGAPKPHSNISQPTVCKLGTTAEYKPEVQDHEV